MSNAIKQPAQGEEISHHGLFAIRGSLDGEKSKQEFVEREQFIGLKIGDEEFYLAIATVNEIVMLLPITYVPRAEAFVEGVINLRGTILPAINLRKMMGLPKGDRTAASRIVISNYEGSTIGLIVDAITYVVALLPDEIEEQSLPGKSTGSDIIHRISKFNKKVTGILDLGKILNNAKGGKRGVENE